MVRFDRRFVLRGTFLRRQCLSVWRRVRCGRPSRDNTMTSRLLQCALLFAVWVASCVPMAFSAEVRAFRNIAYGDSVEAASRLNCLDAYAPSSGADHPVVMWIHGGGWRRGDKANVRLKPRAFVDCGFVFASVNYIAGGGIFAFLVSCRSRENSSCMLGCWTHFPYDSTRSPTSTA